MTETVLSDLTDKVCKREYLVLIMGNFFRIGLVFIWGTLVTGFALAQTPLPLTPQDWQKERREVFPELKLLPGWSSSLSALALAHAQDLIRRGVLSHRDAQGRDTAQRAGEAGLPPGEYGEVVGAGPQWEKIWQAWRKSPPHRELLLEPHWLAWGGATVQDGNVLVCVIDEYR